MCVCECVCTLRITPSSLIASALHPHMNPPLFHRTPHHTTLRTPGMDMAAVSSAIVSLLQEKGPLEGEVSRSDRFGDEVTGAGRGRVESEKDGGGAKGACGWLEVFSVNTQTLFDPPPSLPPTCSRLTGKYFLAEFYSMHKKVGVFVCHKCVLGAGGGGC